MSLIAELKRRNVIRMAGLYLVGAWLLTQVASTLLPVFEAPGWVMKVLVGMLASGFLVALGFSWVFELTPDGLKRDADVAPDQSIAPQTARKMERLLLVLLGIALAYFAFDKFMLAPKRDASLMASTSAATRAAADRAAATPGKKPAVTDKSIAVLAFENMSSDKDNEYFSDGIAEEILNSLSKVEDLRVAGRTSSFSFKGRHVDLREIGTTLGVAHVLEGSVRKQGDKVRITAQLIRSADGIHLWSETYDGTLDDVFALQEKIARAITRELKVVLSGEQATRLVNAGTENTDAYALYLQASAIFNNRNGARYHDAIAALGKATTLDPSYARAYARLASLYVVLPNYAEVDVIAVQEELLRYARKASELDPTLAEPYAAIGFSYGKFARRLVDQRKAFDRALELDPDDATANFWFGLSLIKAGYRERGLALIDRALVNDPMLPNALRWRGILYFYAGDIDRAEQFLDRARDAGLTFADYSLAEIVDSRGNKSEALKLAIKGSEAFFSRLSVPERIVLAEGLYADAAARERALAFVETYLAQPHKSLYGQFLALLVRLNEPARALAVVRTTQTSDTTDFFVQLWSPQGRPVRLLPGFNDFLGEFGFIELWDEYGAPDLCRKNAKGEYVCD